MRQRRSGVAAGSLVLVIAMVGVLGSPARGAPVLVDFEDIGDLRGPGEGPGQAVTDQYAGRGVRFNGPFALDYARGFPTPMPDFPRVGTAAIEPCYALEFCTTPVEMAFTAPQQRVQVWVGHRNPLAEPVDVRLVAFDADGAVVGRTAARLGPSDDPVPIATPLEVTDPPARIAAAEVDVAGIDTGLAVDAIEFDQGAPELEISDTAVDFGDVEVGEEAERPVTVANVGTAPLAIEGVTLDAAVFTLADDGCTEQVLPPDASCALAVRFRPADEGRVTAALTVTSDDPDGADTVTLSATGLSEIGGEPALEFSRDGIDFGTVEVGERAERRLTATNAGTGALTVEGVRVAGGGAFTVAGDGCGQQTLEPAASCEITVVFEPTDVGGAGTTLVVSSDAPGSPHAVALAGAGGVPGRLVEVPDLFGMTLEEAEEAVGAAELSLRPEGDVAEGATVETQSPAAGSTVAAGAPVEVTFRAATPPPGGGALAAWMLWVLAGALGVLVAAWASSSRTTRWVRKHVRFRPRSDPSGEVMVEKLDGQPSYSVRIVPRPDAGTQTLDEVTR